VLIAGDLPVYWTASFHSQQAAEKALKALLTRHQIEFARTHNIGELLLLVEPVVPGLSRRLDAARDLTPHAVADRYPGDVTPVGRETARRHAGLARSVVDAVAHELQAYLTQSRSTS
jgi:HEPN domain-containing protein